jgi:hypothetical protein
VLRWKREDPNILLAARISLYVIPNGERDLNARSKRLTLRGGCGGGGKIVLRVKREVGKEATGSGGILSWTARLWKGGCYEWERLFQTRGFGFIMVLVQ